MNKIKWIIFGSLAVGAVVFLLLIKNGLIPGLDSLKDTSIVNIEKIDINAIQPANDQDGNIADNVFGNPDSKVTLIEYGDYQCPPCGSVYPLIKTVTEKYKDKIRFVFRNFPITTMHANAKAAAGTVEAAGLQGKFWEMHNKIYENQSDWENLSATERGNFFENYAKEFNLDINKFNIDIASTSITNKINYDYELGKKAGVEGTPTFYLNGNKLAQDIFGDQTQLSTALDLEISKNQ